MRNWGAPGLVLALALLGAAAGEDLLVLQRCGAARTWEDAIWAAGGTSCSGWAAARPSSPLPPTGAARRPPSPPAGSGCPQPAPLGATSAQQATREMGGGPR